MKTQISYLPATTTMTPEQALDSAKRLEYKDVLIIGYDDDGELLIRSSRMSRSDALWLLESAKLRTMKVIE
jgi:L-ascorbate metabolism protein UlaG (beta-lactamase superfamily)